MSTSEALTQFAWLTIAEFAFGVDVRQIQDIITLTAPQRLDLPASFLPHVSFWRYREHLLPVFDITAELGRSALPCDARPALAVTCWRADCLIAVRISSIERMVAASLTALKALPVVLTPMTRKCGLWGFYATPETILPLIDLAQMIPARDLQTLLAMRAHPDVLADKRGECG